MDHNEKVKALLGERSDAIKKLAGDENLASGIREAAELLTLSFHEGGKTLVCGNGGSAADAQHIAAELSGRFYIDREPLNAEALHVNSSYLTAVANDYSFSEVYSRLVKARGKKGDVIIGLSTSGNSANIIEALAEAGRRGMKRIALTGAGGGKLKEHCDLLINVPSNDTPLVQEMHIIAGHIICQLVEENLFKNGQ